MQSNPTNPRSFLQTLILKPISSLDENNQTESISSEEDNIPLYKLRHNPSSPCTDTPLVDANSPLDLSPVVIYETLNLFIQSGERLSQMTKVYNDVQAVTKLLEEKERDLELAAKIGKSLLQQNQEQSERIEELERELDTSRDVIGQLKHEIASKKDLLDIYLKNEDEQMQQEEEESELYFSLDESINASLRSWKASHILTHLERKVNTLENENKQLKDETSATRSEIEEGECKELQLIQECSKQLSSTTKQLGLLTEELTLKNEDNQRLQQEVDKLKGTAKNLEKQIRKLNTETEELESALRVAHECQHELTCELIDMKDKHQTLLVAFHDKQEECRELAKRNSLQNFFTYADSLAYELEHSSNYSNPDDKSQDSNGFDFGGPCITPDSLLSAESFASMGTSESNAASGTSKHESNTSLSTIDSAPPTLVPVARTIVKSSNLLTNKLRYLKPLEGSSILNQWQKLASPNLNILLDNKEKCVSRIQANLAATSKAQLEALQRRMTCPTTTTTITTSVSNNFMTTHSVYTLTTTSVSQTRECVTRVTTTLDSAQSSTGRGHSSQSLSISAQPDLLKNLNSQSPNTMTEKPSPNKVADRNEISLGGLNELGRLMGRPDCLSLLSNMQPLNSKRQLVTKVMMSSSSDNNGAESTGHAFRANLSVLRSLRKGGFT